MLKVFVYINKVQKVPSVFSRCEKMAKCFIQLSRCNHESSDMIPIKSSSKTEESSHKRVKHEFNGKAIMNLCLEKFDDDLLYFPEILSKDEWVGLIDWGANIEETLRKIKYDEILSNDKVPNDVLDKLKSLNLFGKQIPKKYGGLELTNTENSYVQEILGIYPSIARMLAENEEMGIKALVKYGTEEQKQKYLPKLAKGETMISFAFLEESSSLMDCKSYIGLEATHCKDHFVLKGRKKWVYNAKNADVFLVLGSELVAVDDKRMILNTVFLVDKNLEGVRIVPPMKKYWFKGLEVCEVVFDEVIVKNEDVLGGYGKGFELFQDVVKNNRTSLVAECSTVLKRLFHDAIDKSKGNSFLNKPLSSFQYCELALGELACLAYAAESVAYYLASRADYYENPDLSVEMYMGKIFGSEMIQEALQIYFNLLGKNGYVKESFVEELVQNAHYYSIIDDTGFDVKVNIWYMHLKDQHQDHAQSLDKSVRSHKSKKVLHSELFIMTHTIHYLANELATSVKQITDPKNHPLQSLKFNIFISSHKQDGGVPRLDLSLCVHRLVSPCAEDLEYCLSRLKYTSYKTLHKFGNQVLKNDYDVIIICDMLINIYALIACIARASRAGFLDLPDAKYEADLAVAFSNRTVEKVRNLSNLLGRNEEELNSYAEIGREAINSKEYMVEHPLMRNF